MENIPFKIYSASAGSGKTFTLVKEYLKICLSTKSPKKFIEILAITFTNKAAAEMKERIVKSLKAFSNPDKAEQTERDMMKLLAGETGLSLEELQNRAQLVFETILHNYSQFSIGTIDKFTHRIIRTFAQDLDLPANFEVEMEHQLLLKQAVDLLISRTGEDEKLTQLFVNFIQDKTADDKSWLIENDFYTIAEELLKESGQEHCDSLKKLSLDDFFKLRKEIHKYFNEIDKELSAIGLGFKSDCEGKGLEAQWIVGGAKSGLPKYFEFLRTKQWEKYLPSNANLKNLEKDTWYAGKAPKESYSEIDALQEKFYPLAKRALEILEDYPKYVHFKLIARNFYSMAVLHEISKEMQHIKEQNNIIPIGEFNKKIAEVLQNEEGNFIYERLGERYAHYFIDEFQDTSELQWKNLLPLIENAIADGEKPGSAMLVGDAKQAIYRWRGGEVDQFIDLQHLAADTSSQGAYNMERLSLENNYRSTEEVVDFNNKLFSSIAHQVEKEKYRDLFKDLNAQQVKGEGGYVSLEYIENGAEHDDMQKQACLETIRDLKEDGFNYGDICILTRTKAKGAVIVKMLSDENVPVISSESLLLEQSTEVRFLLNFLRFLNEPNHPRYRFKLIEFLQEKELCPWTLENINLQLGELCEASEERFNAFLKEIIEDFDMLKWRSISLIELCHKIIKAFKLEETARVYMQFFLDELWVYSNKYSQDLYGFLNYWNERAHKLSIAIPEGINAVQVMTIHKSKGLEFPVVLFPFANWNATSERDAKSWVEIDEPELQDLPTSLIPLGKQLESSTPHLKTVYKEHKAKVLLDNLNMLYVALTRPKTRLYIYTSPNGRGKNLSEFFDTFLKSEGDWEDGKTQYSFGDKVKASPKKRAENKNIQLAQPVEDISKILRISRQAPKMWEVENPEKGADKGRKVHEILSYIKTTNDIDAALKRALRQGLIANSEEAEMRSLLERTLQNPEVKTYFAQGLKVKNEEEILLKNGEVLRPDRLVFNGNDVSIIDYKTGEANATHQEQILGYKLHIEQMGYNVKECVLVYINEASIELERV
jgi:ATP-dependent exoDNAse (exonuclease V) beta subunit